MTTSDPVNFDRQANQPPGPNQSGVIFFPGSAGIYRDGVLIGGIGVSGDGVEEDDFVTAGGIRNALREDSTTGDYMPPLDIRADQFFHLGVRLPNWKFPQLPGGGNPGG